MFRVYVLLSYLDVLIAALFSLLAPLLVTLLPDWNSPLRVALGLVLVIFTPGYVLAVVLFPKRDDLDGPERVALSVGLSFASVAMIGFVLSQLGWGIRMTSVAIGVAVFTVAAVIVAIDRRRRLLPEQRFTLPSLPLDLDELKRAGVLVVTLILLGSVIALVERDNRPETFTEFYLLGQSGELVDYPKTLGAGEAFTLMVGITNQENEGMSYRLEGPINKRLSISDLPVGATWEQPVTFKTPATSGEAKLTFDLYREDDTVPYRSVYLFVTITSSEKAPTLAN
jgi:uncharacterized membrane protein